MVQSVTSSVLWAVIRIAPLIFTSRSPLRVTTSTYSTSPGIRQHLIFMSSFAVPSLTTALYPSHSPFLGTDPVFATKKSLVSDLHEEHDPRKWSEMGFSEGEVKTGRVWVWTYGFVLPTVDEVETLKKANAK